MKEQKPFFSLAEMGAILISTNSGIAQAELQCN